MCHEHFFSKYIINPFTTEHFHPEQKFVFNLQLNISGSKTDFGERFFVPI